MGDLRKPRFLLGTRASCPHLSNKMRASRPRSQGFSKVANGGMPTDGIRPVSMTVSPKRYYDEIGLIAGLGIRSGGARPDQIKKMLQFCKIPVYNLYLCWSAAAVERFSGR